MARPAGGLGGGEADDAGGRQGVPQAGHGPGVVLPGVAHRRRRALVGEDVADGVGEEDLVLGEAEVHGAYFLGRPRTRSAMMLRWISLVPA